MKTLAKFAGLLALALTLSLPMTSARADSIGFGDGDMMTKMAPMLDLMKKKLGEKRFAELMKAVGPIAAKMVDADGNFSFDLNGWDGTGLDGIDIGGLGDWGGYYADGTGLGGIGIDLPTIRSWAGHGKRHWRIR